ncbi:biopolymer transport protein ExbD [Arcticibacter tournemirensis]|uniref:Biopolymer transporter ExbD n=1 Tax=Arcticibacter tournemirensis TaxID=699437 RepID=A0A4Q0MC18_9SPHI|nr:biopolymer transporter ExbD [Arcticibacter tournemirensis]KAA8483318.1 biopolymer transporter ExbD [Arcticibacter tournemirensis]RXF70734.1 biopolymer transporter ExbD [Arcticibacter tournemirensis]TQM50995.1 biopolymer transport protein ExbD [Arcticibacter tournemirensis]
MNLRRRNRPAAEVQTSAMNDIMFFLMLFFLIASTVTNPNVIKLLLPRSDSGQSISKKTVSIAVTKDLEYFLDKQPIALEQIQPRLLVYKQQVEELTIILSVDRTVAIQDVVQIMDIANKMGVKLVLATEPK